VLPKYRRRGIASLIVRELYTRLQEDYTILTSHAGQTGIVRKVLASLDGEEVYMKDALKESILLLLHSDQDIAELTRACKKHYPDISWNFAKRNPLSRSVEQFKEPVL
jgi:hypothetical protein